MISLPIRLAISVILAFILSSCLDSNLVSIFYTISTALKDVLLLLIPFVVFSYLCSAILSLQGQAIFLIFSIFSLVITSNIINVLTAYGAAFSLVDLLSPINFETIQNPNTVESLWRLPIPMILTADKAMLCGLLLGFVSLLCNFLGYSAFLGFISKVVLNLKSWTTKALNITFIPFLPLYVFGFVLKIGFEGELGTLATAYAPVFFLSLIIIHAYLFFGT